MIKLNLDNAIKVNKLKTYNKKINEIHNMIMNKTGEGKEFLGWYDQPIKFDSLELAKMKKVANRIKSSIDHLLVIGIGGSYLGAKAAVDMIKGLYCKGIQIHFIGNTMSSSYTYQLLDFLKAKRFGICVISKSGTTTEPAVAFRLARKQLIDQVGVKTSASLIVCVTDKSKGALKKFADINKYATFVIPDDIGGRYSVLTPVGTFVMLIAGIKVDNVIKGAKQAYKDLENPDTNTAYKYALTRYLLYKKSKYPVEMMVSYEMQLQSMNEWWKQLFGETEGKAGKALLPTSAIFSTDLHSLGQFIQEGSNVLFETVLKINKPQFDIKIPNDKENIDELNYLTKYSLNKINYIAFEGVLEAHHKVAKKPNIIIELAEMTDKSFGYLVYWFFRAAAMSAYLLNVNPFNQPGVEIYKKNMFKLLGKTKKSN